MITYTINSEKRQAKTNWQEVTLGEYVQAVSSSMVEAICLLAGLTQQEYAVAEGSVLLEPVVALLETEPEAARPAWLPTNLGADNIGKLELCRLYLREQEEYPEHAYSFIYAVYRWPEKYDALLAISGAGFPQHLLEQANLLPAPEALGVVFHVLQELHRINERYAPILDKEPTEEQYQAGIDRFEKYGFYATLLSFSNGDLSKAADLLQVPADVFYTALCVDTEKADYEEKYRSLIANQS